MLAIISSPKIHYLRTSKMITNLRLEKPNNSSGILQSILGVSNSLCFTYVVFLGKFGEYVR